VTDLPPLPRNLDEAAAFFAALTPGDLADLRLGLETVLVLIAIVGFAIWLWRTAPRVRRP